MSRKSPLFLEELENRVTPSITHQPWPDPDHLTLSFVPDGTNAGSGSSRLFGLLNAVAPSSAWEAEILRAFQTWAQYTNLNIGLVTDGAQPLGTTGALESDPRFGDFRIAAAPLAPTAIATTSYFSWSGTTWSGDMVLNTNDKFGINARKSYDLYTVVLHEAGIALGVKDHSPDLESVMYDKYIGVRTGLSSQDIADIQSLYGVRQKGANRNNSFAAATQLGTVLTQQSVQDAIRAPGEVDYYQFSPVSLPLLTSFTVQVKTSGLSFLEPTLSIYDAGFHQISTTSSSSPLSGDLSLTVNGWLPLSNYYFTITGASGSGVFGTGSYQATVTNNIGGPVLNSIPIVSSVLDLLNHSLQTALALPRAFGNNTDQRFDYLQKAALFTSTQQDYYLIHAPDAPSGTAFTMHGLVWELDVNGLHPVVHVYDAQSNPVAVTVLGNQDGSYSIQIANVSPGATYTIEIAALNPDGANSTGRYEMGIKFTTDPPVALALLAGKSLASPGATDTGSLTMNQNGLFHFVLAADNGGISAQTAVTMSVCDSNGNMVLQLSASAGQPPATAVVYLLTGTYTITYSASSSDGTFAPTNYWLLGEVLSDPIGAYTASTTNSPTSGSSSSSGGGYTYGGSSSSNPSSGSPPKYY